jgi:hypothetical protein
VLKRTFKLHLFLAPVNNFGKVFSCMNHTRSIIMKYEVRINCESLYGHSRDKPEIYVNTAIVSEIGYEGVGCIHAFRGRDQ